MRGANDSQGGRFAASFEALHERARKETGLDDFGDPAYRANLEFLLRCYDEESRLGEEGAESTRTNLVNCLKSRLHSNARLAEHPECLDVPLRAPLLIMGLPRTGTTALHKLLAADPASQSLEYWLGCQPDVRPPRDTWPSHPGYQQAAAALARIYAHAPEIESIHSMKPDEADECRLLFLQDFLGLTFSSNATLPSYQDWLLERDMRAPYRRYRDNLKLIGAREPEKRWILKNSSHLWAMEALVEALPDGCLVQTHRDPVELIPSISSLVYRMRRISEPDIRKDEVGRQQLDLWARILDKNMASRSAGHDQILDIHFESFSRDPIATFEQIFEFFDFESSPETEANIRAWAAQNRRDDHAPHRYSAEEYGLTDALIEERFGSYIGWEREIREAH
jgi:hypothetical protein